MGSTFAIANAADSPLYSIPRKDIEGKTTSVMEYEGKVLLVCEWGVERRLLVNYRADPARAIASVTLTSSAIGNS